jgi:hypothetical protein
MHQQLYICQSLDGMYYVTEMSAYPFWGFLLVVYLWACQAVVKFEFWCFSDFLEFCPFIWILVHHLSTPPTIFLVKTLVVLNVSMNIEDEYVSLISFIITVVKLVNYEKGDTCFVEDTLFVSRTHDTNFQWKAFCGDFIQIVRKF